VVARLAQAIRDHRAYFQRPPGGDQPFWGRRVERLEVGPAPRRKLSVERLTETIRATLNYARMRERAELPGARIRSEDGVGKTVALIELETASR
jgi:sterol 3beta-glucosyltransferase